MGSGNRAAEATGASPSSPEGPFITIPGLFISVAFRPDHNDSRLHLADHRSLLLEVRDIDLLGVRLAVVSAASQKDGVFRAEDTHQDPSGF
jgi:hypothetical protein